MADWTPSGNFLIGQNIDESSATQKHELGTVMTMKHATYGVGEFIYLKRTGSLFLGSWVVYEADDFTVGQLSANDIGPVGVSMASDAGSLTGDWYGWYQVDGKAVGRAATGFVDNANVYATATAGVVDDAVVAGDRVKLAKGASAVGTPSSGLAEFEIHRPFMDDALAA